MGRLCGTAHEISGIPALLCLPGWVVGGLEGSWGGVMVGVLVRGGWVCGVLGWGMVGWCVEGGWWWGDEGWVGRWW